MNPTIKYNDREVIEALNRLNRAGRDLRPAMRDIAAALEDSVEEAFQKEASPSGTPWKVLTEHTKARRARTRKWPGQILQVDGRLAGSTTSDYDASSAVVGTGVVYAPTHQFGAEEGEFGSTRSGRPIPFGDIPARPFLGFSTETKEAIVDAINRHLGAGIRR